MKILILAALEKEIDILNKLIYAERKDEFCYAKINNNEIFTAITGVGILNALSSAYSSFPCRRHPRPLLDDPNPQGCPVRSHSVGILGPPGVSGGFAVRIQAAGSGSQPVAEMGTAILRESRHVHRPGCQQGGEM